MSEKKAITTRKEDYSQWYLDIVEQAELAENSAVRGCMVIKPYGYSIWENFQKVLDKNFKDLGHVNAYFPLFIPKSLLTKEAQHVEGFAQESAVVTHHRLITDPITRQVTVDPDAKLDEELVVRPTSETIIYDTFSRWVKSYRDLPLLINQWANVVRWEMRTRPFLRTTEFLWQEGHTAHSTHDEAEVEALQMLKVYQSFAEDYLAIPVIPGQKSESEKFAGALRTYTIEAMMQDGKALQAGTSHNLGDNFAKAFDVKFLDKDGELKYVWQTSWGLSTRMIGALIMTHSDDKGLVVPPKIAPVQIIIVPIWKEESQKDEVLNIVNKIKSDLSDYSVKIDERDYLTVGEKFYEWEKKGVPIRIEIGPKDIANNQVVVVRRDNSEKSFIKLEDLKTTIGERIESIQTDLYNKAKEYRDAKTFKVKSYEELKDVIENKAGFALVPWDDNTDNEKIIKDETKATIRCIPFDQDAISDERSIISDQPAKHWVIFARSY
jgi:prolyl-tRNA synthetase